jgi:hypothetical protein
LAETDVPFKCRERTVSGHLDRPLFGQFQEECHRMSLSDSEFAILRQTIATRGTARMVLFPVTMLGWAALALVVLMFSEAPVAVLLPLAVLVGGFEAIHALHVGVERIGRYLQVYFENLETGPRWETTVMAVGPALPGGGIDPLFSTVFACAAFVNVIPALMPPRTRTEMGVIGVLHLAFVIRVVRARGAAARQRAVELESFRAIHMQIPRSAARSSNPEL